MTRDVTETESAATIQVIDRTRPIPGGEHTRSAALRRRWAANLRSRHGGMARDFARGDEGRLSREQISRRLAAAGPSGFDPVPYLRQTTAASLWMFGTEDDRVPVGESIALLDRLKNEGKDITTITFPGAGHGLLDMPPSAPMAPATLVDWIVKRVHATGR